MVIISQCNRGGNTHFVNFLPLFYSIPPTVYYAYVCHWKLPFSTKFVWWNVVFVVLDYIFQMRWRGECSADAEKQFSVRWRGATVTNEVILVS